MVAALAHFVFRPAHPAPSLVMTMAVVVSRSLPGKRPCGRREMMAGALASFVFRPGRWAPALAMMSVVVVIES